MRAHTHLPPTGIAASAEASAPRVRVEHLSVARDGRVLLEDLNFDVRRGEIFVLLGASGCGKSSLLRHLMGLEAPAAGQILLDGSPLYREGETEADPALLRRAGAMFQSGALWSSMSVIDNVLLPMELFTDWPRRQREAKAREWLAAVDLADAADLAPSALSGGMRKRAAIARALALEPELLYLDEPGAGLDPVTAGRLDALLARLRDERGMTLVMVTHELASVFAVADRAIYLDADRRRALALDTPEALRDHGPAVVRRFLTRADEASSPPASGRSHA